MRKWHVDAGKGAFSVWDSELEETIMFDAQSVERIRAMPIGSTREDEAGWYWTRVS